jgi:hypothetical protein
MSTNCAFISSTQLHHPATAVFARQREAHLRFNINQRQRSATPTALVIHLFCPTIARPAQHQHLATWRRQPTLRSGSIQHQRQPRQHFRSSMRSPSAVHLRVVGMNTQCMRFSSRSVAIGRTLEALATTAEIDIGNMRHQQQLRPSASCALAAIRRL